MNVLNMKVKGSAIAKFARLGMATIYAATTIAGFQLTLPTAAYAADTDAASTEQAHDGKLVRLGLDKSAIIKLPAAAHDVIVGNSDIVDAVLRKKDTIYLFARQIGQTNIFVFDADGQQILGIDFEVTLDTLPLRKLLDRHLPGNTIKIDTINSNVVLTGHARSAEEARLAIDLAQQFAARSVTNGTSSTSSTGATSESSTTASVSTSVINAMTIAGDNQVMLHVKVVEIQRDIIKQLGVDLQAALVAGQTAFNLASVVPFANARLSPNTGVGISDTIGKTRFDSVIRAMETDGLSRTLAEPNLTAVSGQPATFFAGGEFPYQNCTTQVSAVQRLCEISFKKFGVKLDFTPTVFNQDRINLKIATEVSELGVVTDGIPAINTRNATTTLDTTSGGSMMIAGLIRENTRTNINGTPGLKKLPVLGSLFRSRDFQSNETELVVIVTPYLVRPVGNKELQTPDKNFVPASDNQSIFFGKLHRQYDRSGKAPQGEYTGSVGYIVE